MHRIVVGVTSLALSIGSVVPALGSTGTGARVARSDYTLATSVVEHGPVAFVGDQRFGYAITKVRRGDQRVTVDVRDTSSVPVLAYVEQWTGKRYVQLGTICGATKKSLRLAADHGSLNVRPTYGACGTGASAPTTGVVTFRFTR